MNCMYQQFQPKRKQLSKNSDQNESNFRSSDAKNSRRSAIMGFMSTTNISYLALKPSVNISLESPFFYIKETSVHEIMQRKRKQNYSLL
ncbi:hypothetical protein RJ641_027593 [Dillenia turbinata]|uniref:Uncharacterized protein n=1 Tax=Dillenia turbinata TaxID=194707 RepID=A0AAN8W5N6_9MAGN